MRSVPCIQQGCKHCEAQFYTDPPTKKKNSDKTVQPTVKPR